MRDIDSLVAMLESPDASVRYDACEQLRVASSIPDRAVLSLENTLRDPDELVADAARRALALHKPESAKVTRLPTPTRPSLDQKDASWRCLDAMGRVLLGLLGGTVGGLFFSYRAMEAMQSSGAIPVTGYNILIPLIGTLVGGGLGVVTIFVVHLVMRPGQSRVLVALVAGFVLNALLVGGWFLWVTRTRSALVAGLVSSSVLVGGYFWWKAHASGALSRRVNRPRNAAELVARYEAGGRDFRSWKLRGADLTGADLSEANLSASELQRARLDGADLRGVALRGADLSRADLSEADLRDASLYEADLGRANLEGADLGEASLHGAQLRRANLTAATVADEQLAQAGSLAGATLPSRTVYE